MERQAETRGIRHTQADSAREVGEAAATGSGLWPLLRDAQSIQKSLRSQARDGNYLGLLKPEHHELSGYSKRGKADCQVVRKDYPI